MSGTDWTQIEREAREQVSAELETLANTPLAFGDFIAWADCRFGRTDDLSVVHRVGFPKGNDPYTTCGEQIPAPTRWLTLSPRFVQSLGPCRFCEAEHARAVQENAHAA